MIWVVIVLKNKSVRDKSLNFLSVDEKNLEQKKGFQVIIYPYTTKTPQTSIHNVYIVNSWSLSHRVNIWGLPLCHPTIYVWK